MEQQDSFTWGWVFWGVVIGLVIGLVGFFIWYTSTDEYNHKGNNEPYKNDPYREQQIEDTEAQLETLEDVLYPPYPQ